MKKILTGLLTLLFTSILYSQYIESSTVVFEGERYSVDIHKFENLDITRVDIKKENQELFRTRYIDNGKIQEWPPQIKLRDDKVVKDIVNTTLSGYIDNNLPGNVRFTYVFKISTVNGKIDDILFHMEIPNSIKNLNCTIPPAVFIELGGKLKQSLTYEIKSEYKIYDFLISSIEISFATDSPQIISCRHI